MKGWALAIIVVILILLGGAIYFALQSGVASPVSPASTTSDQGSTSNLVSSTTPEATSTITEAARFTSPLSGTLVTSPLTVTGEARGTWYFEASFPVKVIDANGAVLGQAPAQAQADWMTTDFVPFKTTVSFSAPTTTSGFVVLEKDNPSGLPQNDSSVMIPIRFK